MYYAQAWVLTHWFMSDPARYEKLQAYMKLVGDGADPVASMEKVTGLTPERLDNVLHGYVGGGLKYSMYDAQPAPAVTVSAMPASADDLMLLSVRMRIDNKGNADMAGSPP